MAKWQVSYEYSSRVHVEEVYANNLSECLKIIASKERIRPALLKRLTIVPKGEM